MSVPSWTSSKLGRVWTYGPLRKGEFAEVIWEELMPNRWSMNAQVKQRIGWGQRGGSYTELAQAKRQVEEYVASARKDTAPAAKKSKASKAAASKPKKAKAFEITKVTGTKAVDLGTIGDTAKPARKLAAEKADAPPAKAKRRVVKASEPEVAADEVKLPEPPKSPRLVELLELEGELRSSVDALDIEHRHELTFEDVPRCADRFEAPVEGELHRATEELPVPLSDDERLTAGQDAATALFALRRLEDLKKDVNSKLKELIDLYEEHVLVLLRQVDTSHASVPVTVITYANSNGMHADSIRSDSGEYLRSRDLTADEKQLRLA